MALLEKPVDDGSAAVMRKIMLRYRVQTKPGVDVPAGTTAQRPGSPNAGMIRWNTDLALYEGYTDSAWGLIGAAPVNALGNSSGTITLDFSTATNFSLTLNANASNTLANPSNLSAGQSGVIVVTQDATGSRTLTFGSYWKFASGAAPTLTTSANAVDALAYYVESATRITTRFIGDVK